jgi:hypothetical protein
MKMLLKITAPVLPLLIAWPLWAQTTQPSSQPASLPAPSPASQPVADSSKELEAMRQEIARLEKKLAELEEATDEAAELKQLVESMSTHIAALDEAVAKGGVAAPSSGNNSSRLTGASFGEDWTWRVGKSSTSLGGYLGFKYTKPIDEDETIFPSFTVPRFVLFLHSIVTERISFVMELETENVGVNTLDNFRFRGEVVLEFAAIDFELTDWLSLRSGVVLVPMGKFNLVHDDPVQDFAERSLVNTFLLPSTWFEPGVGVFGEKLLGEDALVRYEGYIIQGLTDRIDSNGGLRGARGTMSFDTNESKGFVGRVSVEPFLGLELGLSGYMGYYDTASIRSISMSALDVTWRKGPLEIVGEAAHISLEHGFNNNGVLVPTGMRGLMVEGHYHVYLDSLKKYKGLKNPHITLMARYDTTNTDINKTEDDRLRLSGGFNFRPVEDLVFKAEYHRDLEGFSETVLDDRLVFSSALSF